MEYMLRLYGPSSMLRWEYTFSMASDAMACDFVERSLRHDSAARSAMGADLFNTTEDYVVSSYTIKADTNITKIAP